MTSPSPSRSQHGTLDPNSYTAHRLHHGTPQHLHITSRRIFVGPIPTGWIKTHRKEWYKQQLRVHYSSRAPTFGLAQMTNGDRRLTGVEVPRQIQSEGVRDGEQRMGGALSSAEPIPITSSPSSLGRPGLFKMQSAPPSSSPPRGQRPRPPSRSAYTLPRTPSTPHTPRSPDFGHFLRRGESFATARENWDAEDREEQGEESGRVSEETTRSAGSTRALPPMTTFIETIAEESGPAGVSASGEGAGSGSVASASSMGHANSLQPLLEEREEEGERNREPSGQQDHHPPKRQRSSFWSLSRVSTQIDGPKPLRSVATNSSTRSRVAGGLVRFNTTVETREYDKRMQQKIRNMSRSRSVRRGRGLYVGSPKREGEIIRMDSMLVQIEVADRQQQFPEEYDENESRRIETRLADKWKEYVVVCREGGPGKVPLSLHFYKSRNIPAIDRKHVSSKSSRLIPLGRDTKVNIYSSLDKTLVIWLPYRHGTVIYIMRPRCSSTSVEWYTFLRTALGERRLQTLLIAVPDLSLTLQIQNPFERLEEKLQGDDDNEVAIEEKAVAANLLCQSMNMLEGVKEWADIVQYWNTHERMGLAWRRYDRLEWVHGANEKRMHGSLAMQKTHELELRPKAHYPTEVRIGPGEKMMEPPPIEGFLIRRTSGKGRSERLGRAFQKQLYFSVHDNFLCFCKPPKAQPPRPLSAYRSRNGGEPTDNEIGEMLPLIYSITPYKLNADCGIEWLEEPTLSECEQKDREAYEEAERRVNTLLRAEGFVDLCKVKSVVATTTNPEGSANGGATSLSGLSALKADRCFELVMENGLTLRLQSFNQRTRSEWVQRLTDLVQYWRARDREDLAIVRRTRAANLAQLRVDEEMESELGQWARKWEVSRTMASPELYNVCGLSSCRAITLAGVLYRKPRRHSTFRRFNVILCHGELLVFDNAHRSQSGQEQASTHQDRHISILLRDSYVYSGLLTGSDLLYQSQSFDTNNPGRHSLPRIYPDGYTSQDEDTMTCFVVWHGTKRSSFQAMDEEGRKTRHRVPQLGKHGKANVFKARSRVERDLWVSNIAMEIERLNSGMGEEVKVTAIEKARPLGGMVET